MGSCGTMDAEEMSSTTVNVTSPQPRTDEVTQLCFDLRVFYVRVSNYMVQDSTPEFLTLNHTPLDSESLLEVNGKIIDGATSESVTSFLRRDRVDKKSEEVTFVTTNCISFTRGVMFTVFNGKEVMLYGALEMSNNDDGIKEKPSPGSKWRLRCESKVVDDSGFMKGQFVDDGFKPGMLPTLEVYIAGCFCGGPVILTNKLQLNNGKKHGELDSHSDYEINGIYRNGGYRTDHFPSAFDLQLSGYRNYENEKEGELRHLFQGRREYLEGEGEGELSWFNAGVRVGVGISLGICLGVGVGVGLLARTYQKACQSLARGLR